MYTIVGDPHIKNSNLDVAEELFAFVEGMNQAVIWLGDMLDTKEVIRGKSLNALLAYLTRSKLHHTILVGNHDWFNLECKEHSLETLKALPNVRIVDRLIVESHNGIFTPSAFLPYIHDQDKLRAMLSEIPDGYNVFAHLDVAGHDYGNGHISTHGLKLEELDRFAFVVSGHFHKYQHSQNLIYLGTPFSHSFGEANQAKFLASFDPDNGTLNLIKSDLRKHVSIEVDCDREPQLYDMDTVSTDDYYRVILTGSQENINAFNRSQVAHLNVKWISRPTGLVLNDVSIDETASNEVQFARWALNVRNLDQETVDLGLAIMEAVK